MKHITFILVLISLLSINLLAQTDQGRITLGGGLSFSSTTSKTDPASSENTTTTFSIVPRIGYYLSNTVKIGLGIGYTSNTTEFKPQTGTSTKNTQTAFIVNPFIRFYVPASPQVDLFLQGNVSFQSGTYETTPGTAKGTTTDIGIFVTPGIEYRISQRISLDLGVGQIGYFMETNKPDGTPTVKSLNNTFRFNFNLDAVQLGVNIFL